METFLSKYLGELLIGLALIVFGWAFSNWAGTLKETSKEVLSQLRLLLKEFHEFKLSVEHRVRGVEKDVEHLKEGRAEEN